MAGEPFDVSTSAGFEPQKREYFSRRVAMYFPERSNKPDFVYGDPETEFYRLVNDGAIPLDRGDKGDIGIGWEGVTVGPLTPLNTIKTVGIFNIPEVGDVKTAVSERNYPAAITGSIQIMVRTNGRIQQIFYPQVVDGKSKGFYRRLQTGIPDTWNPWEFYASQRVDNTAGRAIYTWDDTANREQLIYGDTGWRDVSTLLTNEYTGSLLFRRIGYTVYTRIILNKPTSASVNGDFLATTPAGFVSDSGGWIYFPVRGSNSSQTFYIYRKATLWAIESGPTDPGQIRAEIIYTTNQPWPASLPGISVTGSSGAIPNS